MDENIVRRQAANKGATPDRFARTFASLALPYIITAGAKGDGLRLAFDLESDGLLDDATKVHCIVVEDLDSDQVDEYGPDRIDDALEHLGRANYLTGHNIAGFDLPLLRRLHGWAPAATCTIVDTLVASRLILPHLDDLDDQAGAMSKSPLGKLRGRHSLEAHGVRLGIPKVGADITDWSECTKEMQERCAGDVRITKALWRFLQPDGQAPRAMKLEHLVAAICERVTAAGMPFDVAGAELLRGRLEAGLTELETQLKAQFPEVTNFSSRKQLGELFEAHGWEPEKRTEKTGQPVINDEVLESIAALYPEFAGLAEYYLVKRLLGQLANGAQALIKNVGADGRIHGGLIHIGTPHSRAKHMQPNLAQVPSPKKGGDHAAEIRALFRHPGDWLFVACDQSNLQDRGFAHYLAEHDGGAYAQTFADGIDQHWQTAIALALVPAGTERDKESKVHTAIREGAKRFRYAFLYGAGATQLGRIVGDTVRAVQHLDAESDLRSRVFHGRTLLERFLQATPGLAQLRAKLKAHYKKHDWLPGLDGRRVPGGADYKTLNRIVTSAEAIICKRWLVQVYDELRERFDYGWSGDVVIIAWIHDELVACCRPEIAEQVGELIVRHAKEAGERYKFRVPLDAEFKIGRDWAGTPVDEDPAISSAVPAETASFSVAPRASSSGSPADDAAIDGEVVQDDRNSPVITTEVVEPIAEHDHGHGHASEWSGGSRGEAKRDTHAEDHADKPFSDLFLRRRGYALKRVFDYTLPDGSVLYRQNRYELRPNAAPTKEHPRKRFLAHRTVDGKDLFGAGARRVIYQWPPIMRAAPGSSIFVAEGEANTDALVNAGYLATTVLSHQWTPECVAALTGHHLSILEDADDDGRKLAAIARAKLAPVAASVRIVPAAHLWKHLEPAGQEPALNDDVEDWINAGGDAAKLLEICREILPDGARLTFIDMSRWDFELVPEQEWAVFNRIPRRECVLFSGEGGAGKSILQLQHCCASALEREWLGVVPEQGPAIFIDAEDDEKVLHRRTKAIAEHYGVRITELIRNGLHLVSWRGIDATLAVPTRNGKMEPTQLYRQLLEAAGDIKPIMIGIAASANVFAGNENDRAQVQQFIGLLTRVAIAANGSIALISHPSLSGINTETGLSGSTQWHNSVRARQFLRGVKPEGGEPVDHDLREIVFKKNNYGPISESIILRWADGLFLPVPGATIDQAAREAAAKHVFLALLDRFIAANRDVSDKLGSNYAPALFSKEDEAKLARLSKRDLEGAMRQLFRDGRIVNEPRPGSKPSRPSYRIVSVKGD